MNSKLSQTKALISHLGDFSAYFGRIHLRPYQLEAAEAVLASVLNNDGLTFVWKFARQSGKDETLAALYQYIMTLYAHRDISIISASPTLTPQSELAIQRLESRLTYRVLHRHAWTGQNHLTVFGQLKALAGSWRPQHIVIDATGVGEGLWALLDKSFPTRVIPVKFTTSTKSEIGYRFLAIIETGRFRDCSPDAALPQSPPISGADARRPLGGRIPSRAEVDQQYAACISEVLIGPAKTLRWGVPDGTRDPDGSLIHDDFILADSLTAILDRLDWHIHIEPFIIPAPDPLHEMSRTRRPTFGF